MGIGKDSLKVAMFEWIPGGKVRGKESKGWKGPLAEKGKTKEMIGLKSGRSMENGKLGL